MPTSILLWINLLLCLMIFPPVLQTSDPLFQQLQETSQVKLDHQIDSFSGRYTTTLTQYPCTEVEGQSISYERIDGYDHQTQTHFLIAEQSIYCGGLGAFGLEIQYWTQDEEWLYYTDAREGQPDGTMDTDWLPTLWQYHIPTASRTYLGQAKFSTDRRFLVAWNPLPIRVYTVDSAIPITFTPMIANLAVVDILWMPTAKGFFYIQSEFPIRSETRSSAVYVDLTTQTQQLIIEG